MFASDIETCKHVSASLGSFVIPATERESPFLGLLALFHYRANWAFFVFVPARFAVVAPKINDLQMTLFPFAFGKSFF